MTSLVASTWVVGSPPNPTARLRLFCFAHAGGGPSVFSSWPSALPRDVEVCAVQLPGREARLDEPPIQDWKEVVARMAAALEPWIDRPCALFGHSLGAALAFELARHLRRAGPSRLAHLFVSGRGAPHLPSNDPPRYDLPDNEFVAALRELTGTPEEVLSSPELLALFLPVLRADFRLSDTYMPARDAPLDVPISAYGGVDDVRVSAERLDGWREHTARGFHRVMFPGGHFFLKEHRDAVLAELSRELCRITIAMTAQMEGHRR